jgi:serine/threonine protein kinase
MTPTALGRVWEESFAPEALRLARRFESAWRAGQGDCPDPSDFLAGDRREQPGNLLALLRVDMALRRQEGDRGGAEHYRRRYPELDDDVLVGLVYEEFCLREEAGEAPDPAEYEARYPEVADVLRGVLDIHGLVAGCAATATHEAAPPDLFPEAGQTIAGFRLVEELGRGTFARVFRAQERQLADRAVVLKVSRLGTREPQTLARLQHTYIVPVHSHQTDPSSGLHLLCMPFFGRMTLERVLAAPAVKAARSGSELAAALACLQPAEGGLRPSGRAELEGRSYPRAIAWWGANLAEALHHAHERGVLHRDVKPSNILVTDEGLPMLLDFNLARDPGADIGGVGRERVGGTLAYMAPEHLEAMLGHATGPADPRSDLYALGLVLLEALGTPPLSRPAGSALTADLPFRLLEGRRAGPPRIDTGPRSVPADFAAVLRKCLAPDPADRHGSAGELAADLRAVANAGPLRYTHEPLWSRVTGTVRRNRLRIAVAVPLLLAVVASAVARYQEQAAGLRREALARRFLDRGAHSLGHDDCVEAAARFASAAELAEGWASLHRLRRDALDKREEALEAASLRAQADALNRDADTLRFRLLGFGGDRSTASHDLEAALAPFGVLADPSWSRHVRLSRLDGPRREWLLGEVNELLFLWVVAAATDARGDPDIAQRAVVYCDRALAFASPVGPWDTLRDWARWQAGLIASPPEIPGDTAREDSARACFQWSLLAKLVKNRRLALVWLERARSLRPNDYWNQYALAYNCEQTGDVDGALRHYEAAIALRPSAPWAWFNRAHLHAFRRGAWGVALEDLDRALATSHGLSDDLARFRIERGLVRQAVGDVVGARSDFDSVIASGARGRLASAARLDRARLDVETGRPRRAWADVVALVGSDPDDGTARLAHARLALRLGWPDVAEADLSRLLRVGARFPASTRAQWLEGRAVARLALGRSADAEVDAAAALRLEPSPSRSRLRARAALAAGHEVDPGLLDPDAIGSWPVGGPPLARDLRAAVDRLRAAEVCPSGHDSRSRTALLARAAMLSALGEHADAIAEAVRLASRFPTPSSFALCAQVRLRADDWPGAASDVARGLSRDRDDPRLQTLRARILLRNGEPAAALTWLDRACLQDEAGPARIWRARTLMALGRPEAAVKDWSLVQEHDPQDPIAYLGRAHAFRRLGLWLNVLADLEYAAERVPDGSPLLDRVALEYVASLPAIPNRFPRIVGLARRMLLGHLRSAIPAILQGPVARSFEPLRHQAAGGGPA